MTTIYPFTTGGLADALEALGDTPRAFALRLADLGIKGKQNDECRCPIANYIRTIWPDAADISVGQGEIIVRNGRPGSETYSVARLEYDDHDVIEDFLIDFDSGRYEDLIEEAAA